MWLVGALVRQCERGMSSCIASKHDQPLLQCFVSCVKLGVLEAEKEHATELVVEFFFNLAYL